MMTEQQSDAVIERRARDLKAEVGANVIIVVCSFPSRGTCIQGNPSKELVADLLAVLLKHGHRVGGFS